MAETSGTQTPKTRSKTGKSSTRKPAATKKTSAAKTASTTKKAATAKPTAKKAAPDTKTAARKTTRKATPRKSTTKTTARRTALIGAEERRRLIAEAAYLRAEQRGFVGGDPMSDWLAAEADIDASLRGPTH